MLATESVNDSEKMTGLWRKELLGVKKWRDSEERGGKQERKSDEESSRDVSVERVWMEGGIRME